MHCFSSSLMVIRRHDVILCKTLHLLHHLEMVRSPPRFDNVLLMVTLKGRPTAQANAPMIVATATTTMRRALPSDLVKACARSASFSLLHRTSKGLGPSRALFRGHRANVCMSIVRKMKTSKSLKSLSPVRSPVCRYSCSEA